jgi:ABC-type antimicrobial peptide transport system permease subunit
MMECEALQRTIITTLLAATAKLLLQLSDPGLLSGHLLIDLLLAIPLVVLTVVQTILRGPVFSLTLGTVWLPTIGMFLRAIELIERLLQMTLGAFLLHRLLRHVLGNKVQFRTSRFIQTTKEQ